MKKVRPVVARNARELAKVLGLAPAEGMEIEFRSDLNDKIIEVVEQERIDTFRRSAARSHVTYSRDRDSKPKYSRHFNGSHAACIGLARGASETPIQKRRLRFTSSASSH